MSALGPYNILSVKSKKKVQWPNFTNSYLCSFPLFSLGQWPCLFLKGGKAVLVQLCSSQQYNRRIPEYIPGTDEANS